MIKKYILYFPVEEETMLMNIPPLDRMGIRILVYDFTILSSCLVWNYLPAFRIRDLKQFHGKWLV